MLRTSNDTVAGQEPDRGELTAWVLEPLPKVAPPVRKRARQGRRVRCNANAHVTAFGEDEGAADGPRPPAQLVHRNLRSEPDLDVKASECLRHAVQLGLH